MRFNRHPVQRLGLDNAVSATLALPGPLAEVAPNVLTLHHGYRRRPDARGPSYRIGETAVTSPVDMVVESAGQPHGDRASIVVAGRETALNLRGYNLVALDQSGAVLASVVFDTFGAPAAGRRLAEWVRELPVGTIVAGAVKDEASGLLTADAVRELGALGVGRRSAASVPRVSCVRWGEGGSARGRDRGDGAAAGHGDDRPDRARCGLRAPGARLHGGYPLTRVRDPLSGGDRHAVEEHAHVAEVGYGKLENPGLIKRDSDKPRETPASKGYRGGSAFKSVHAAPRD